MSDRAIIGAFLKGLVQRVGGVDAAAAVLSATHRVEVHKGTISKRIHGMLDWPLVDIMALEDAAGDRCVRQWLAQSLPGVSDGCIIASAAKASQEHGEAMTAILRFASGRGDRQTARKEIQDSLTATARLAARLAGDDE